MRDMEISNFEDTNFLGFQQGCPVFVDHIDGEVTSEYSLAVLTKIHADGNILCAANCGCLFSTAHILLHLEC